MRTLPFILTAALALQAPFAVPAVASRLVAAQYCAACGLTVAVRAPETLPDDPHAPADNAPDFEDSPLKPGELPPAAQPRAGTPQPGDRQAPDASGQKDTTAGQAKRPAAPSLDTLFSMLQREDSDEARTRVAHRIQVMWIRSGSATIDLLMARASEALDSKDPQLALDLLDAVVRLKPDYAAGWNRRAAAHFLAGDLGRALVDIERTLALEPRHWGALSGLAAIQRATDDDKDALATYERILKVYPHQEKAEAAARELRKKTAGREL